LDEDVKELLRRILRALEELREEIYELKKARKDSLGELMDSIMQNVSNVVEREVSRAFKVIKKGADKRVIFYPFKKGGAFFFDIASIFPSEKRKVEMEIEETLRDIEHEVKPEEAETIYERAQRFEEFISELNPSEVAETLSVLSNPDRLSILKLLYDKDRYFGELEEILEIGPSSLRHHLSRLISAGLVRQERTRGKYVITRRGIAALILASYLHRRILRFSEDFGEEGEDEV